MRKLRHGTTVDSYINQLRGLNYHEKIKDIAQVTGCLNSPSVHPSPTGCKNSIFLDRHKWKDNMVGAAVGHASSAKKRFVYKFVIRQRLGI